MDDDRRAAERAEDAALVARARGDDPDAFGRLYDRWFDRVHDVAYRIVHDDAAAADVAQDAFVSAWRNIAKLEKPEAFGGWLLRIARNGALDRKRRDARATPVDDEGLAMIEAGGPSAASAPAGFRVEDRTRESDDPARAAEDNELVALVWESAAALGERDAEILDLGLRHGMTPAEVGDVIGMNRNAANQAVHRVRNRLKAAVEARVLWRSGEPVCAGLSAALTEANVTKFGADAVRITTKHAETCAECQERRQTRLEPSKMFAALPILSIPMLKSRIAHALDDAGVPMQESSTFADAEPGPGSTGGTRHRRARQAVFVGAGAILVVLGLFALADDADTPTTTKAIGSSVTTTTKPKDVTTTTVAVAAPNDDPAASSTTSTTRAGQVSFPLPNQEIVPPPGPPPTLPAPPQVSITGPQRADGRTSIVVSWSSAGADSVLVQGSNGFSSAAHNGSHRYCATGMEGSCRNVTVTYTITAGNAGGSTSASWTVQVA